MDGLICDLKSTRSRLHIGYACLSDTTLVNGFQQGFVARRSDGSTRTKTLLCGCRLIENQPCLRHVGAAIIDVLVYRQSLGKIKDDE